MGDEGAAERAGPPGVHGEQPADRHGEVQLLLQLAGQPFLRGLGVLDRAARQLQVRLVRGRQDEHPPVGVQHDAGGGDEGGGPGGVVRAHRVGGGVVGRPVGRAVGHCGLLWSCGSTGRIHGADPYPARAAALRAPRSTVRGQARARSIPPIVTMVAATSPSSTRQAEGRASSPLSSRAP